ncbi:hypothetical protein D3C81_2036750 [compost metagenome]
MAADLQPQAEIRSNDCPADPVQIRMGVPAVGQKINSEQQISLILSCFNPGRAIIIPVMQAVQPDIGRSAVIVHIGQQRPSLIP